VASSNSKLQLAEAHLPRSVLRPARSFGRAVARSAAMHDVFDVLERFANTGVTLTLCGETGVGKDVIAHGIHENGSCAHGPFVVFDCASVAANLAESELLGHERGSFTGAIGAHPGAFERAHQGTVFLDEVGELPLDLQSRLLRVLESHRVRRIGGTIERPVDVRVIAATHRDLRAEVAAGRFREDLYFRLAVAVVDIPPLRARVEDIPALVHRLLADLGRSDLRVSEGAMALLQRHAWPGNVRELKNAIACAIAYLDKGNLVLEADHLRLLPSSCDDTARIDALSLGGYELQSIEREAIRQTLERLQGNKVSAARTLGIAVSTLNQKLKKHGLQ
jgi:transcriptional regulator with PAS, ATPase and Fis domain